MLSVAESFRASSVTARRRYARIPEVLEIPNLIELQLSSFDWLVRVVCWSVRSVMGIDAMATARLITFSKSWE